MLSACTASPYVIDHIQAERYKIRVQDVPRNRVSTFEWDVHTTAPTWRTWNVILDMRETYRLTGSYDLADTPEMLKPEHVRFILTYKPHWYLPSITSVVEARILPRELAVEAECVAGGDLEECYFHTSVLPQENGKGSLIRMRGFLKRPWYFSFGSSAWLIERDIRALAAGLDYRIVAAKYSTPDTQYPWTDFDALAAASSEQATVPDTRRPEIALQQLETYGAPNTVASLANLAGDYLATRLTQTRAFDVVTSADVNLIIRYMGERWALLCGKTDNDCQQRIAELTRADYLLTGGLRVENGKYDVHLALLDAARGVGVWRFQQTSEPEIESLKATLDAAAEALRGFAPAVPRPTQH